MGPPREIRRASWSVSGGTLAPRPNEKGQADEDHGQGKNLTHGDTRQDEVQVCVGLSEQLDEDAGQTIADQEDAG
jgi:hypothetical protein